MLRAWVNFTRFIGNYRYYRKVGMSPHDARSLAQLTLPDR